VPCSLLLKESDKLRFRPKSRGSETGVEDACPPKPGRRIEVIVWLVLIAASGSEYLVKQHWQAQVHPLVKQVKSYSFFQEKQRCGEMMLDKFDLEVVKVA
jgi:hypothetical protein